MEPQPSTSLELRLCLFDCDGTLVDSQHSIIGAMQRAFVSADLAPPSPSGIREVIGLSLAEAIVTLLADADEPRHLVRALVERFRAELLDHNEVASPDPLFPGALEAFDALAARGWLLGLATGKSHASALATLEEHGLTDRFVTIQTADVAASKPAPDMVLRALAETGVSVRRTVVVGDTVHDIAMAKNAGVVAAGVDWGYHPAEALRRAGAVVVVSDFESLVGWLDTAVEAAG